MMTPRSLLAGSSALFAAAFLVAALTPDPARACGGLFCSTSPVDQNAERILFEVHEDLSVTATVEISFTGDPSAFSWIVPVPETPSHMDVAPPSALRLLDAATAPRIIPPPTTCSDALRNSGGLAPPWAAADAEDGATGGGGVIVEDLPVVGPYDPEVISADDPELLIQWLEENDYLVTNEMKPFIAEYTQAGFKFLGVKLTPDAGVQDISPLSFTCPSQDGAPIIPLKLTAVASEPEMSVIVFIAGPQRFAPLNYRQLLVPTDLVQFDPRTQVSNYFPLVSWLVDQEGGKAFITEYADETSDAQSLVDNTFLPTNDEAEAREHVEGLFGRTQYFTRMYTRISGWEMDDDPVFGPFSGGDVANVHDLSNRPRIDVCAPTPVEPVPCGNTYCGAGAVCATTEDGGEGCVCGEGAVARAITQPQGRMSLSFGQTVTCQDASLDMLQSALAEIGDPCDGFSCGENGRCMPVNGFPTCECDAGFAAINDPSRPNGLKCRKVEEIFTPRQLLWPDGIDAGRPLPMCACVGAADGLLGPAASGLALLVGVGLVFRRRRR